VASAAETLRVLKMLEGHEKLNFVKRILRPEDYPRLSLGNGMNASHLMTYGENEAGDEFYVYPTVVQDPKSGQLRKLADEEAWKHAMETGENIPLSSRDDAEWLSKYYKTLWGFVPGNAVNPHAGIQR
jgi:hypothetical protein